MRIDRSPRALSRILSSLESLGDGKGEGNGDEEGGERRDGNPPADYRMVAARSTR